MDLKVERPASVNSDSSLEPMETSSSNKTGISEANSSIAVKTSNESDNIESDDNIEESYQIRKKHEINNSLRRKNVRLCVDDILKRFLPSSNSTNNTNKNVTMKKSNNSYHNKNESSNTAASPNSNNNNINHHHDEEDLMEDGDERLNSSGNNNTGATMGSKANSDMKTMKYVCPICDVISTTPHEFTAHIRGHNNDSSDDNQNYTCRICSKVLSSASSLDRHVLVHTGERPFKCKYCHLTFTTNGNMHRHIRTHKQHERENYESDGSTDSSNSAASINSNNTTPNHHNNNNNHDFVGGEKRKNSDDDALNNKRKLKTINNNNNIINNNKPQSFCCPVCVRNDFSSMLSLENHMDSEHPTIPAKCRHCEIVFKSHKALNAHRCGSSMHKNHPSATQGFRDLTFVDFTSDKFPIIAKSLCEASLRQPIANQIFECLKCSRAFPCASALDLHSKDCYQHEEMTPAKRSRQMSESSEEDVKRDDFFANLDLQNKSNAMSLGSTTVGTSDLLSTPSTTATTDKSSPYHSPFNMSMNSKYESRRTMMSSSPSFAQQNDTKDLADIQSIINVTSSSGGFWKQLDRPMSTSDKEYDASNKDDEEQQDAFTAEFRKMKMRGEFPCRLCSSVFPNLRALKGHNRVHLSAAGPGPYKCNMCPYLINDKAALIRHMRSHNGDRPYECAICNYAFTTKANCERHLRNRHGKNTRDEIKRAIIYHPTEDSSCDDPVKKMQMFVTPEHKKSENSRERTTPVSHLRENLSFDLTPKIQVRSLEKLIEPSRESISVFEKPKVVLPETKPMDLSMDVLDLSKKSKESEKVPDDEELDEDKPPSEFDMSFFEKNQQLLFLQQQLLSEALPKLNPAQYIQLLYRNFGFPSAFPFNPLFLQNSLLNQNSEMNDMKNFLPMNPMSGGSMMTNPFASPPLSNNSSISDSNSKHNDSLQASTPTSAPEPITPVKFLDSPKSQSSQISTPIKPSAPPLSPGPIKMVIKNGVLMPKQKQRRYRTERPFACEHCSARFTLRSNMERHIKQQHPQYWSSRQKGGHHLMRRGPNITSPSPLPSSNLQTATTNNFSSNTFGAISDQVKYAILAQQLKARDNPTSLILQNALSQAGGNHHGGSMATIVNSNDDDEPKLVIDEEDDEDYDEPATLSSSNKNKSSEMVDSNNVARKIAQNILEHAKKINNTNSMLMSSLKDTKELEARLNANFILKPEIARQREKFLEAAQSNKEEDLASVSKLVDNATNVMSFRRFFNRPADTSNVDQSDEEGLVASGSASESNNSGTDDPNPTNPENQKKKSAYSMAPNRVSCPYCQRMFPWSSSLRRHILTHTGQKPFKCSHCPLLFTTKSNCDRHLLRKHGDVESAMSVPVPIDEMPEPKKERVAPLPSNDLGKSAPMLANSVQSQLLLQNLTTAVSKAQTEMQLSAGSGGVTNSDLPFKCHLCEASFGERAQCLEHIKQAHEQEFNLIISKVNLESESEVHTASPDDDEGTDGKGGKYPDYANRKVICVFCMRRFWSTEDLRRHVRTHSGERPFQCGICLRRFTLKHSMLRHRKKHAKHGHSGNNNSTGNSASDMSDDETIPTPTTNGTSIGIAQTHKIPDLISKDLIWKLAMAKKEQNSRNEENNDNDASDLIGNLLGISDRGILNKLLSSPDEAAKLLGVRGNE